MTEIETPQLSQIEVVASGLDSPRKLSFGLDGALYVTEAGRGGTGASVPSPSIPGASLFYGATGAITRIQDGTVERVVTGLPSLALPDGGDASGVNDIEFDAYGNAYAIVGFASNPANRDSIIQVSDFSQLIAIDDFDGGSSWTRLIDFGAYELNNNPDGQDVNTNLYDLLIEDNTAYVLDAGGNDLLSQSAFSGEPTLETVFPSRTVTDPLTGQAVVQQSVPTAVTVGADGAFYVSELTGYPLQAGAAQVYRLTADGQPEVYADGFTNIVDLASDESGGLYVLEYDADGILTGGDAGALIYLSPDGKTRTTITDDLVSPTGLAIGSDGDLYVSNKGFIAGQGEVLRLSLEQETSFDPDPIYDQVKHYTLPSELQAGIFYGTSFHNQQTGEFQPIDSEGIAVGLIQGSLDGAVPPSYSQTTYDHILNPPKVSVTVEGANHYGITNADNLEREPNRPTLDQATVNGAIGRWSGSFLQSHRFGDQGAFDYVYNTGGDLNPNVNVISPTSVY